jgi:hypothetical protein
MVSVLKTPTDLANEVEKVPLIAENDLPMSSFREPEARASGSSVEAPRDTRNIDTKGRV